MPQINGSDHYLHVAVVLADLFLLTSNELVFIEPLWCHRTFGCFSVQKLVSLIESHLCVFGFIFFFSFFPVWSLYQGNADLLQ
jgi:hypothetical protein